MKTLTLFLSLLFSFPFVLSAQMVGETLQKVSAALDNRQWDQAVTLFRQAVNTNVEKAEMFYWTGVDKSLEVSSRIGRELAAYYKNHAAMTKRIFFTKSCFKNLRMMLIVLCHVLRWKYAVGGSLKLWRLTGKYCHWMRIIWQPIFLSVIIFI